jgi:hypothetical protein
MDFQNLQNKQIHRVFPKKIECGPDLPGMGRNSADPAQIRWRCTGDDFQMAGRWGSAVSALGGRIGTRRFWPCNQVTIDGDRLSSPRQKRGCQWGLGFGREFTGAHLGWLGIDLAVVFVCGSSKKVGDVIREAIIKAV